MSVIPNTRLAVDLESYDRRKRKDRQPSGSPPPLFSRGWHRSDYVRCLLKTLPRPSLYFMLYSNTWAWLSRTFTISPVFLASLLSSPSSAHGHTHLLCASVTSTLHSDPQSHYSLWLPPVGTFWITLGTSPLEELLCSSYISIRTLLPLGSLPSSLPLHTKLNKGHPKTSFLCTWNFLIYKKGLCKCN